MTEQELRLLFLQDIKVNVKDPGYLKFINSKPATKYIMWLENNLIDSYHGLLEIKNNLKIKE